MTKEEEEYAKTLFGDAVDEFMADDGTLSKKEYELAKRLAIKEAERRAAAIAAEEDRRSHTFMGEMRRAWNESKTEFVASFFKGIKGLVTAMVTASTGVIIAWYTGVLDKLGG